MQLKILCRNNNIRCAGRSQNIFNMLKRVTAVQVFCLLMLLICHNGQSKECILDVYIEDELIHNYPRFASEIELDLNYLSRISSKYEKGIQDQGLFSMSSCNDFLKLSHYIKHGRYDPPISLCISLESCSRKNQIGQIQYVLPTTYKDHFLMLLSDFIRINGFYRKWETMNLIFDDYSVFIVNNIIRSSHSSKSYFKTNIMFQTYKVDKLNIDLQVNQYLQDNINNFGGKNFLIFLDYNSSINVLNQLELTVNHSSSFILESNWLFFITDSNGVEMNITPFWATVFKNLAVVLLGQQINDSQLQVQNRNLLQCIYNNVDNGFNSLKSHNLPSSKISKVFENTGVCFKDIPPWTIYNAINTSKTAIINATKWVPGYGFDHSLKGVFMNRKTANVVAIRGIIMNDPPWVIIKSCSSKNIQNAQGIAIEIVKEFQKRLSFELELVCLKDLAGNFSSNLEDYSSNWKIVSSLLLQKKADLYIGAAVIKQERKREVDFLNAFYLEEYVIISGKPKVLPTTTLLSETFTMEVWLFLLIIIIIIIISLSFLQIFYLKRKEKKLKFNKFFFSDNCLTTLGVLLQQGVSLASSSHSSQILFVIWLLASIVICAYYNGTLYSFLTMPRYTKEIKSLQNLFSEKGLTWSINERDRADSTMWESNETEFLIFREYASSHQKIDSDLLKKVKERQHALISRLSSAHELLYHDNLKKGFKSYVIGDPLFYDKVSFALYKNHQLYGLFNEELIDMLSTGLITKWKQQYSSQLMFKFQVKTSQTKFLILKMYKLQGAFYLLIICLSLALCLLLIECCIKANISLARNFCEMKLFKKLR